MDFTDVGLDSESFVLGKSDRTRGDGNGGLGGVNEGEVTCVWERARGSRQNEQDGDRV